MTKNRGRPVNPELTEKQTAAVYMREVRRMTWESIGNRLGGVARGTAMNTYKKAKRKLAGKSASLPTIAEIKEAAEAEGPFGGSSEALVAKYFDAGGESRLVDDNSIGRALSLIIDKLLFFTANDDMGMASASMKEKVLALGILIDKRQLLRGEPTAIMRVQDIRKLDEVGKLLQAEMERRGMMVDVTPERGNG